MELEWKTVIAMLGMLDLILSLAVHIKNLEDQREHYHIVVEIEMFEQIPIEHERSFEYVPIAPLPHDNPFDALPLPNNPFSD